MPPTKADPTQAARTGGQEGVTMEEKAKGRMKQAAGAVTGEFVRIRKYVENAIEKESS